MNHFSVMRKLLFFVLLSVSCLTASAQQVKYELNYNRIKLSGAKDYVPCTGTLTIYDDLRVVAFARFGNRSIRKSFFIKSTYHLLAICLQNTTSSKENKEQFMVATSGKWVAYISENDNDRFYLENTGEYANEKIAALLLEDIEDHRGIFSDFKNPFDIEFPLSFSSTIPIATEDGGSYCKIRPSTDGGEYVITVNTKTGKFLDDTNFEDYTVEIEEYKNMPADWLKIKRRHPRVLIISVEPNTPNINRFANLQFRVNDKKVGCIFVLQLAKGVYMP